MPGSVKTAVGRISPRCQIGQPALLLRLGPAQADQLGGDLRSRAQRAQADIAAGKLLGHHAHGELAEAEAAIGLRHGEAEDAEGRQLLDDLEGDQHILAMPAMGGLAMVFREAPELVAYQLQGLVLQRALAEAAFAP